MLLRAAIALLLLTAAARADTDPVAAGRARYAPLLQAEAARRDLPPALADAGATVESGYDPAAIGGSGEVGLMQVLPSTAEMLGFRGNLVQLADPSTNVALGVQYLAGAWAATGGRLCDTLMKYRAGYGEDTMSLRSVIYCRRARDYLASIGSPLASGPGAAIPPITPEMIVADAAANHAGRAPLLLTAAETARLRHGQRSAADSQRYWAAEEARIRSLRARLPGRRKQALLF
jgi:soluble lytic murein transglycosylase-like protein